jgi:hypothetical protein
MKKIITLSLLIAFTAPFVSCERDDTNEGPALTDLFAPFEFRDELSADRSSVDFSTGESVIFSASFNKQVEWQITITGQETGAQKIISGLSREIGANEAMWDGSTTNLPMFKDESCEVDLFIPSDSAHSYFTVNVTGVKSNAGFVVADFESGSLNPGWTSPFVQAGANMSFNVTQTEVAGQGSYYYDMGGEVNWDYLIGLVYMDADAYGADWFPLSANPEEVYFNFMLNVPDNITNAIVLFQLREDDNGDGTFDDANEDMYSLELKEFESGWQLISIKYSDLTALVNGQPANPAGNKLHEPDKLTQIQLLFLADPTTGYSQALLDYVIFTEGGPLKP